MHKSKMKLEIRFSTVRRPLKIANTRLITSSISIAASLRRKF